MSQPASRSALSLVDAPIRATLIRMTLPMIVGMAMLFSFSLVDTFFISLLGTEALTAVSFTFPITFTVTSLAIGLGIGTSAVVAKYLGRCDQLRAQQASTVTGYLAVLLTAVLAGLTYVFMDGLFRAMGASDTILPSIRAYMVIWLPGSVVMVAIMTGNSVLRACGDTRTASLVLAVGGLLNAVLTPLFIFGPGPFPALGIAGAALATVLSWSLSLGWLTYLLAFQLNLVSRQLPSRAVMQSAGREMLRIGVPAAGANMMTPLATGILTAIVAGFGDPAVAAFGVGSRLEPMATLVILAMSSTLPPLVSQNFGAGRLDRVEEAYRTSVGFILKFQLAVFLLLAVAAPLLAKVFSDDPEVGHAITLYLWILPLGYGMQGVIILTNSSLNALHRPMEALYLSMARFFVFFVPLAWLGSRGFGLPGFFVGAVVGNGLMAAVSWLAFHRALRQERGLAAAEPAPATASSGGAEHVPDHGQ